MFQRFLLPLASGCTITLGGLCFVTTASGKSLAAELGPRDYHIETMLVEAGKPLAAIISSSRQPAYASIAAKVQGHVRDLTGVELPILDAEQVTTDAVLARTNAIVLGNLATSKFVETLYWEWYTITDMWYPGRGGYEVRTLHDPYGTGKNVILLGGSDDRGVAEAADAFCGLLSGREALKVGRLMEIRLGEGCLPPQPKDFKEWVDPRWRIFRDVQGAPPGHTLASKMGLIYYYSGDEAYARRFRELALNTDCISHAHHYSAYMNAIVWDLIEESPVFSDDDRRAITAKLLAHARGPDSGGMVQSLANFREDLALLDRHSAMVAICTLTESRYFSKYWPSEEWTHNLAVVRKFFNRQMTTAKGESDLGGRGIYTYLECALIPALLLRDRRFIDSGALRQWGELCLMHCDNTGYMPQSGQNSANDYPTYTLAACAALLRDGGFLATLPRREEAERIAGSSVTVTSFLTGQAWSVGLQPQPMRKMVGVYYLPLTLWEYEVRDKSVPFEEAYDKLTMRTGFERDDQYLLLDGLHGGPISKPWPDANAIVCFGQNGRIFLDNSGAGESRAQHNVVTVSKDGLGATSDRLAALKAVANLPTFGYAHSRIQRYCFSSWDRHLFWRKGGWFVVLDRLVVTDEGRYVFECIWQTVGEPTMEGSNFASIVWEWGQENTPRDVLHIKNAEGLPLRYSEQRIGAEGFPVETARWKHYCQREGMNRVRQVAERAMKPGDEQVFTNLLYVGGDRTRARHDIVKLNPDVAVLTGDEPAYVGVVRKGTFERGPLRLSGSAFCVSPSSIAVVQGTRIEAPGIAIEASGPCNLELETATGRVTCEARATVVMRAGGREHRCPAGITLFSVPVPTETEIAALKAQIERDAAAASRTSEVSATAARPARLEALWVCEVGAEVTAATAADVDGDGRVEVLVGLADGRALCLDAEGREQWGFRTEGAVHALAHALLAGRPTVLIGSDDQHLYALPAGGGEPLWKRKCHVDPEAAGWTTHEEARVRVIIAEDLDGDGRLEVVCGTGGGALEAFSDTGEPRWFTPFRYGVVDRLAAVAMPDGTKTLLASCAVTSYQSMTKRFSADGRLLEANAMYRQRGGDMSPAPGLLVRDLDGDGKPEAIIGRGGAFPELALHDATTNEKPRWIHTLADSVTCVEAADVNGDDEPEVVAGSPSGWLTVFTQAGKLLWSLPMPHEICAVAAGKAGLFVACADSAVYQVSPDGRIAARHALAGMPLGYFARMDGAVVIGDTSGRVTALKDRL